MKRIRRAVRRQRGAIAVEAAIVFPVFLIFLTLPSIYWSFYFYKYSAAQKAVHDVALYLSTAPRLEMTTAGPDGNPAALTVAKNIFAKEMGGLSPPELGIGCFYQQVSGAVTVRPCSLTNNLDYKQALVQFSVSIETSYTDPYSNMDSGLKISPYANVPYMGN